MSDQILTLTPDETLALRGAIRIAVNYLATYPESHEQERCDSMLLAQIFHRINEE